MAESETWNEAIAKELSFDCLGEPERPITEEMCANAGARYAAVFSRAEDMVKAALEVKRRNQDVFCKLPFCVTIEAEAFGADVSLNSLYGVPAVSHFRYERVEDIPTLPAMDFSQGRVHEVLRAASMLSEAGETVILNMEGPFTILGQLVPSKQIYKGIYRQQEKLRSLSRWITSQLVRYAREAEAHGVSILSYADPTVAAELISPQLYTELCGEISYEVLQAIENATEKVVIHLCNKTSVAFQKAGFCTMERIVPKAGVSYGEALLQAIQAPDVRCIGHGCIQRTYCPAGGCLYKLNLK
ncbi:putative uroporphyrinogen decarboxylase family protein [Selenomonas ruminantium subsp. lactilytica TAM6421]|uniref:Putative uroporphyrinogen decarboxylase family protein n=1 Tax=Selenomonas ruminantium subsp. lactilytica (strain NBRC 103574 / TAM6421) TaxID=927704 RepID=I0GUN8_SELRL|nr:uroporphyrinogen decarboxylase family protein [Selenomonas ruminantium]BAL84475.1 putative uroporphyrinogen decarboxylase family protein [Selenomonas ruminantium subsp. lactilytica TAM6421]